jgi:hypothetical protein
VRAVAAIAEGLDPAVFVPVEDLVAGLARNPERGAQGRHLRKDSRQTIPLKNGLRYLRHPRRRIVGKAVALEPATGFSFDTPAVVRPR